MSKEPVDYFTLLGYVNKLKISVYDLSQIDCEFNHRAKVGSGSAMDVYRGRLREEEIAVALKMPNVNISDKMPDKRLHMVLGDIRQELRIMKHLEEHPNIINLYGVTFMDLKPVIIVELAVDNLANYLWRRKERGR